MQEKDQRFLRAIGNEIVCGTPEFQSAKVVQLASDWKIVPRRTRTVKTSLKRLFIRQFLLLIANASQFTSFTASLDAVQAV